MTTRCLWPQFLAGDPNAHYRLQEEQHDDHHDDDHVVAIPDDDDDDDDKASFAQKVNEAGMQARRVTTMKPSCSRHVAVT